MRDRNSMLGSEERGCVSRVGTGSNVRGRFGFRARVFRFDSIVRRDVLEKTCGETVMYFENRARWKSGVLGKFLGGGDILDGTSIVVRIIIIRSIGSECLFHFVIQIISICDFHTRSLLSFLVLTYYTSNVYDTSLDN